MNARHIFTEATPCFTPSPEVMADIELYSERATAWEQMTEAASDFTTNRYEMAKRRFDRLAQRN